MTWTVLDWGSPVAGDATKSPAASWVLKQGPEETGVPPAEPSKLFVVMLCVGGWKMGFRAPHLAHDPLLPARR